MVKPCFGMVSSKSMLAPSRYGTLILSTTTSTPSKSDRVAVEQPLVEVELVDQAGASAGLHGDAQAQVVAAFLLEQAADLAGSDLGELDAVGGQLRPLGGAVVSSWVVVLIAISLTWVYITCYVAALCLP